MLLAVETSAPGIRESTRLTSWMSDGPYCRPWFSRRDRKGTTTGLSAPFRASLASQPRRRCAHHGAASALVEREQQH